MMKRLFFCLSLTLMAAPAFAGVDPLPTAKDRFGNTITATPVVQLDKDGATVSGRATSTSTGGTVASTTAYQSALAANTARAGCLVQNISTATLKIFLGAPGSANDAAAIQIGPGGSFSCTSPGGLVLTDQISVSATAVSAAFVVVSQ